MLRYNFRFRHRRLPKAMGRTETGHGKGPSGRIEKLQQLVTAVVRHERIEGSLAQMDETRGYVERLVQEAQKHGDKHRATMEMADYWLLEKDLVHKLFKVLAPRYQNYATSFTALHRLPHRYPGNATPAAILELKENPWPPVVPHHREIRGSLVNVLVSEMRKETQKDRFTASPEGGATSPPVTSQTPSDVTDSLHADRTSPEVPKEGTPV